MDTFVAYQPILENAILHQPETVFKAIVDPHVCLRHSSANLPRMRFESTRPVPCHKASGIVRPLQAAENRCSWSLFSPEATLCLEGNLIGASRVPMRFVKLEGILAKSP